METGESPEACGLASLNTTVNITRGAISSTGGRWELSLKAVLCPPLARWGTCIHEHTQHMLVHVHTHTVTSHMTTLEKRNRKSHLILWMCNWKYKLKSQTCNKSRRKEARRSFGWNQSTKFLQNFCETLISILSQILHRNKIFKLII